MIEKSTIARQGIYNIENELYAYELLYRKNNKQNQCRNSESSDYEDTLDLIHHFKQIGKLKILQESIGFFNVNYRFLNSKKYLELPKNSILELMDFDINEIELREIIESVKKDGFRIALDDLLYEHLNNDLIEVSDIVKIDYIDNTFSEIEEMVKKLKPTGVVFLAEKIESLEMYNHAVELGFELFQGYYFSRPEILINQDSII